MYGGMTSHLPLKINTANVIPPIFASSILIFPATLAQFANHPWVQTAAGALAPGQWLHDLVYIILIIFFAFFYTAVVFNPSDVAENMKKAGGYIPGIRPGQKTAEYIERVLSRITLSGAIYLCIVSLLPTILVRQFNVPFYFGGTALLIVVGVALGYRGANGNAFDHPQLRRIHEAGAVARKKGLRRGRGRARRIAGAAGRGKGNSGKAASGKIWRLSDFDGRYLAQGRGGADSA